MSQPRIPEHQVERMFRLTRELLRKFQMRDRNEITCCGVSVSQCHALGVLGDQGEITMVQLARSLFLDKSTATRVVDQLIKRKLVARRYGERDRREILVSLTAAGKQLWQSILESQLESQRQILASIPADKRDQLIESLELLSTAVHHWLAACCAPGKVELPAKRDLGSHLQPNR